MAKPQTSTRRLLDLILGGQLTSFVVERRDHGDSWRVIGRDLYQRTGVDVTGETLRQWYGDDDRKEMAG
jgi:hypothetical protein